MREMIGAYQYLRLADAPHVYANFTSWCGKVSLVFDEYMKWTWLIGILNMKITQKNGLCTPSLIS